MSVDATRWAWRQDCGRATSKLVLLSLADRADDKGVCYPSIQRLERDTCCDRKTVMSALRQLESAGLISAQKVNGKGSIYTLSVNQPVPETAPVAVPEMEPVAKTVLVPDTGLVPVPKTVLGSTKNGTGTGTKNGTENLSVEPNKNQPDEPNKKTARELPSWLPRDSWSGFEDHRKRSRKPLSDRARELVIAKLDALRAKGHDPQALLDTAVERGWLTVFEPSTPALRVISSHRQQGPGPASAYVQYREIE